MKAWAYILPVIIPLTLFRTDPVFSQMRGLEGRWTLHYAKTKGLGNMKVLKLRPFHENDKFKNLTLAWNFKASTGYAVEEMYWRVNVSDSLQGNSKSYGYNGKSFTWVWESKDKIKVFHFNAIWEFKIRWMRSGHLWLVRVHSPHPLFSNPIPHVTFK